jgi:hypothetical protein
MLFLAVQLVDVFWAIFVLLGIEKVRITPGITATNPLDLYYMPYTHGLLSSLLWAGGAIVLSQLVPAMKRWGGALVIGLAVFSHWLFDLLVHRPDLPLYDNSFKVGLGLWNLPLLAFTLEVGLLLGGMYLYVRKTKAVTPGGRIGLIIFALIMMAVQLTVFFGAPPSSSQEVAVSALVSYGLFAAMAYWLERKRSEAPVGAPT